MIHAIKQSCSQCDFSEQFINGQQLICEQDNPLQAVYRAHIIDYGSLSSGELVAIIEQWVLGGATATTDLGVVIIFDTSCPVSINSTSDTVCQQPSATVESNIQNNIIVIGAVVGGVCVAIVSLVVVAVVVILKMKKMRRYLSPFTFHKLLVTLDGT